MKYIVTVNDTQYEVEVEKGVAQVLSKMQVTTQAVSAAPVAAAAPVAQAHSEQAAVAAGTVIEAPMPGVITSLVKAVGDKVKKGETLLTMEAMKMENEISSVKDGVVIQILTTKGATVSTGTPLVVLQ